MCDDSGRRLSAGVPGTGEEIFKSFQATVPRNLHRLQRRDIGPGQSQRAPQECCEAICAGKSCQGKSQLLADLYRLVSAHLSRGPVCGFRSQQAVGPNSD